MQTYNIFSNIMVQSVQPEAAVGLGCTICLATDRWAATVIAVSPSGKTVTVQRDKATRTDSLGMSEDQDYEFRRNPDGATYDFRLTKSGWKQLGGHKWLSLGHRSEYYDYSF